MNAKHDGQLNNDYLMDLHYTTMVLEGMTIFTNHIRDDQSYSHSFIFFNNNVPISNFTIRIFSIYLHLLDVHILKWP